jgi:hypothetical protein
MSSAQQYSEALHPPPHPIQASINSERRGPCRAELQMLSPSPTTFSPACNLDSPPRAPLICTSNGRLTRHLQHGSAGSLAALVRLGRLERGRGDDSLGAAPSHLSARLPSGFPLADFLQALPPKQRSVIANLAQLRRHENGSSRLQWQPYVRLESYWIWTRTEKLWTSCLRCRE